MIILIDDFALLAYKLKKIKRSGWKNKLNINDCESVADHTYLMSILSMIISDVQGLDTTKIMRMTLLHDLPESITGDIMPDQMQKNEKTLKENNAMLKILSSLPTKLEKMYFKLWKEFQEGETVEAKFVHELDKLEMVIQAKIYQKNGIDENKIKPFLDSAINDIKSDKMKEILKKFIAEP